MDSIFSGKKSFSRCVAIWILVNFVFSSVIPPSAFAQSAAGLMAPGALVTASPAFIPLLVKGLKIHPENPMLFDFIVDSGNLKLASNSLAFNAESKKLIKYFMAALTIKEDDLWVNLSPYEKDRMATAELKQTDLGNDMLAQDYLLKQLTASMIYPEKELGKAFWTKIYAQAKEKFGVSDIPVDTFNKVWITADKARVFERQNMAFVVGAHLKVMLESDYIAQEQAALPTRGHSALPGDSVQQGSVSPSMLLTSQPLNVKATDGTNRLPSTLPSELAMNVQALQGNHQSTDQQGISQSASQELSKQIIREIILPAIEKEVNEGQNFAPLRQMFYSMILAYWYKVSLKNALVNQVYADKGKTSGINAIDPALPEAIYQKYLAAYKTGVFNYIKDETDPASGETIPRKYFSGGVNTDLAQHVEIVRNDMAELSVPEKRALDNAAGNFSQINTRFDQAEKSIKAARFYEEAKQAVTVELQRGRDKRYLRYSLNAIGGVKAVYESKSIEVLSNTFNAGPEVPVILFNEFGNTVSRGIALQAFGSSDTLYTMLFYNGVEIHVLARKGSLPFPSDAAMDSAQLSPVHTRELMLALTQELRRYTDTVNLPITTGADIQKYVLEGINPAIVQAMSNARIKTINAWAYLRLKTYFLANTRFTLQREHGAIYSTVRISATWTHADIEAILLNRDDAMVTPGRLKDAAQGTAIDTVRVSMLQAINRVRTNRSALKALRDNLTAATPGENTIIKDEINIKRTLAAQLNFLAESARALVALGGTISDDMGDFINNPVQQRPAAEEVIYGVTDNTLISIEVLARGASHTVDVSRSDVILSLWMPASSYLNLPLEEQAKLMAAYAGWSVKEVKMMRHEASVLPSNDAAQDTAVKIIREGVWQALNRLKSRMVELKQIRKQLETAGASNILALSRDEIIAKRLVMVQQDNLNARVNLFVALGGTISKNPQKFMTKPIKQLPVAEEILYTVTNNTVDGIEVLSDGVRRDINIVASSAVLPVWWPVRYYPDISLEQQVKLSVALAGFSVKGAKITHKDVADAAMILPPKVLSGIKDGLTHMMDIAYVNNIPASAQELNRVLEVSGDFISVAVSEGMAQAGDRPFVVDPVNYHQITEQADRDALAADPNKLLYTITGQTQQGPITVVAVLPRGTALEVATRALNDAEAALKKQAGVLQGFISAQYTPEDWKRFGFDVKAKNAKEEFILRKDYLFEIANIVAALGGTLSDAVKKMLPSRPALISLSKAEYTLANGKIAAIKVWWGSLSQLSFPIEMQRLSATDLFIRLLAKGANLHSNEAVKLVLASHGYNVKGISIEDKSDNAAGSASPDAAKVDGNVLRAGDVLQVDFGIRHIIEKNLELKLMNQLHINPENRNKVRWEDHLSIQDLIRTRIVPGIQAAARMANQQNLSPTTVNLISSYLQNNISFMMLAPGPKDMDTAVAIPVSIKQAWTLQGIVDIWQQSVNTVKLNQGVWAALIKYQEDENVEHWKGGDWHQYVDELVNPAIQEVMRNVGVKGLSGTTYAGVRAYILENTRFVQSTESGDKVPTISLVPVWNKAGIMEIVTKPKDAAQIQPVGDATINSGGIDLNARNMDYGVFREGAGVDAFKFDPAMLQKFKDGDFSGLTPVILSIAPLASPLQLMGL